MAERGKGKETYEFTDNLHDRTNSLEEMVKQDELLITRSNSNFNMCGSEQLDIQEETSVVSKFLNDSSNVSGIKKFVNDKHCETVKKPVKLSMDSQLNFLKNLLNEIQFLREEVRMKNIVKKVCYHRNHRSITNKI